MRSMMVNYITLSIFFLLFSISAAQIPLGSNLIPTNPKSFISPNNKFTLSFIPVTSSHFSAVISVSGIPVWTAGGSATTVDSSGRFQLLLNGNLCLANGSGSTIWESRTANSGITSAGLDNYGNLSLKNGSVTVWSSFDNPTDTILPTQNFTVGNILRSGPYSFSLHSNGNLALTWDEDTLYWNKGLNSSFAWKLTNPSLGLQDIGILQLFDPTLSVPIIRAYSSDYGEGSDVFRFVRLDSDGNLRIYSSTNGNVPMERWSAVSDQCEVYGWCGNLGICSYNDSKPVCGCPSQNFEFLDPEDSRKGCRRKEELEHCTGSAIMLQLDHTKFLTYQPELSSQEYTLGITACKLNCFNGPCNASTSLADGTGVCYLKMSNFISGYQSAALPSTSFIKVCGPELRNPSASGTMQKMVQRLHPWIDAIIILCTLVGFLLLEVGLWLCCCRKSPKFGRLSAHCAVLEYASYAPVLFSYRELHHSTKGFQEKLGTGGFGAVYRGVLCNKTVVAIKRLEGIERGEKQFKMEVATISSTHHLNLVRLFGFCSEGRHRLLVYEFMKNGSLDKFLFTAEKASNGLLDWQTRFSIALGTARGIAYLHQECRDCILHCDIKPENILLDENYKAKVSDFGLVKVADSKDNQYRTSTSVRGTRGYLAPEWLANLPITSKTDVYSYGMVLLEIVSGRRNFEVSEETGRKKFSLWAYEEFGKGNVDHIVDRRLAKLESEEMEEVTRAIGVSFWCIQEQPSHRPAMVKAVQMLEGVVAFEKPPASKTMTKDCVTGTVGKACRNARSFSNFVVSPQASSSASSSSPVLGGLSSTSGRNMRTLTSPV